MFLGPRVQWYQPATLKQLLALRDKFPHTSEKGKPQHRMVMGNTAIGMYTPPSHTSPSLVTRLAHAHILLGGRLTLVIGVQKLPSGQWDKLICNTVTAQNC